VKRASLRRENDCLLFIQRTHSKRGSYNVTEVTEITSQLHLYLTTVVNHTFWWEPCCQLCGIKYSLKSKNEYICRGIQRPFACMIMNDPENKQTFTLTNHFHLCISCFSWAYGLTSTKSYKIYNLLPHKIIRFVRSLSLVQSVALRQIRAEIICLRVNLLAFGVIHACQWPLRNPTCPLSVINFKEYLGNANVFSELAVLTESKMVFFTTGPLLNCSQAHPSQ